MAPEQYASQADERTDVWGLGVTLYELLTLRRAFGGANKEAIRKNVQEATPAMPRSLVGNVPRDLAAIFKKTLHKEPAARYQRATEVAADLGRWLRSEPTWARPARAPRRVWLWARRNQGWATAVLTGLCACIAVVMAVFLVLASDVREKTAKANEAERQAVILKAIAVFGGPHSAGWSKEHWQFWGDAARVGVGKEVRDQAAASLAGLDARVLKSTHLEASSVTLDARGERVLLGGMDARPTRSAAGPRLWDLSADREVKFARPAAEGLVAFRGDTPLTLVGPVRDKQATAELWDLRRGRKLQTYRFANQPARADPPVLALTPDASVVAAAVTGDGGDGVVAVWDTASGKQLVEIPIAATALALSSRGAFVALGDKQGRVAV
jgi:hypothetical protein